MELDPAPGAARGTGVIVPRSSGRIWDVIARAHPTDDEAVEQRLPGERRSVLAPCAGRRSNRTAVPGRARMVTAPAMSLLSSDGRSMASRRCRARQDGEVPRPQQTPRHPTGRTRLSPTSAAAGASADRGSGRRHPDATSTSGVTVLALSGCTSTWRYMNTFHPSRWATSRRMGSWSKSSDSRSRPTNASRCKDRPRDRERRGVPPRRGRPPRSGVRRGEASGVLPPPGSRRVRTAHVARLKSDALRFAEHLGVPSRVEGLSLPTRTTEPFEREGFRSVTSPP